MLPAHQRLDADDPPAGQVVHRLVVDAQFVVIQRMAQGRFHLDMGAGSGGQHAGVEGVGVTPAVLGLEQRGVGVLHQVVDVAGVFRVEADTEAGADIDRLAVDVERRVETVEDAL